MTSTKLGAISNAIKAYAIAQLSGSRELANEVARESAKVLYIASLELACIANMFCVKQGFSEAESKKLRDDAEREFSRKTGINLPPLEGSKKERAIEDR